MPSRRACVKPSPPGTSAGNFRWELPLGTSTGDVHRATEFAVLIQACLNGARMPSFHPALPLGPAAIVHAARACVAAGADALHLHPRDAAGRESLSADSLDGVLSMLRAVLPHTPAGACCPTSRR